MAHFRKSRSVASLRNTQHRASRARSLCKAVLESLELRLLLSGDTLYWQGGNGTWDHISTDHWNKNADGSGDYVAWVDGDNAVFAASNTLTITLAETTSANNVNFGGGALTLA